MKFEYIFFNLIVLTGPVIFSFDKKVNYVKKWKTAFSALLIPFVIFTTWDILVTGRHWWFNQKFTLDLYILGLPLGEWLFFITIPFASLFVWEVLAAYRKNRVIKNLYLIRLLLYFCIPLGILLFSTGKEYTGLVLMALGLVSFLDRLLQTKILVQLRTYPFLAITTGLTFIFNGYLTARPVVIYNEHYQTGFRIWTIPVEDFGYGIALIVLCVIFYEKFKIKKNE